MNIFLIRFLHSISSFDDVFFQNAILCWQKKRKGYVEEFLTPQKKGKNKSKEREMEEVLTPQKKRKSKSKERGMAEVLTPHWREH